MTATVAIGERRVGSGHPAYIIAEAGVNHDGRILVAHELVDRAADAGADAVKFQTFHADSLATAAASRARYQESRLGRDPSQRSMLADLELPDSAWRELRDHARDRGITFLSTPFDDASLDILIELGVPAIKIGSGDLTNSRLLRRAAAAKVPLLCSTGMATLGDCADAIETISAAGGTCVLLHCVSSYPAPEEDVNLRAISTMASLFDVPIGYSDHTLGLTAVLAAIALGATIIEKHFTLDRTMPGPDHRASLEPEELGELIRQIRIVGRMLGDGIKRPASSELANREVVRRSIVYARDLPAGHALNAEDLTLKRPAGGLPPQRESLLIGRCLRRNVTADAQAQLADLHD